MKKRVILFFPHNLSKPRTGAHQRGLQILDGLGSIGGRILLASATISSDSEWNPESANALVKERVERLEIYSPGKGDAFIRHITGKYHHSLKGRVPICSNYWTPPGMRYWFRSLIEEWKPDLIWMNYAYWDRLIDHRQYRKILRVIDIHDLVSLSNQMWNIVAKIPTSEMSDRKLLESGFLDEDFFNRLDLKVDPHEYTLYDNYTYTIAINQQEKDVIRENTRSTQVINLPMTFDVLAGTNDYRGPAVFPTGNNPFNIQGYYYFLIKVLPRILENTPDFLLTVTGYCSKNNVREGQGVELVGFVPDFLNLLISSAFMVCPVIGGTGQLVKVVEGMAHGLPVVILRVAAQRTPVIHEVNGFIAENAEEFSDYCIQLWKDKPLCRKMGSAARETIQEGYARKIMLNKFAEILG
jgi:glycosyltransferase involved in cell wall biosynthesis